MAGRKNPIQKAHTPYRLTIGPALIYFLFLWADLPGSPLGPASSYLKFAGMILLFALTIYVQAGRIDLWTLAAGLTVPCDYLLLFTSRWTMGIALFSLVQSLRLIQRRSGKKNPAAFPCRPPQGYAEKSNSSFPQQLRIVAVFAALAFLPLAFLPADFRFIYSLLFYLTLLLLNLFDALQGRTNILIGSYVLFFLCDLSVGLSHLLPPSAFASVVSFMIWFFYFPSQYGFVFYCLSSQETDREQNAGQRAKGSSEKG